MGPEVTELAGYDPPWIPGPLWRNERLLRLQANAPADLESPGQRRVLFF